MRVIELTRPPSTITFDLSLESHDNQYGTRLDAPGLIGDTSELVDQLSAECFAKNAVLLDLTNKKPGDTIDDEDLEGAEEEAGLTAREGEAVMIQTGWKPGNCDSGNYPVLSENAAEYLEFKRVSVVAVDTPNLDSRADPKFQAHRILLRKKILVVENLTNLGELDESRFSLVVLPLKIHVKATLASALAILGE